MVGDPRLIVDYIRWRVGGWIIHVFRRPSGSYDVFIHMTPWKPSARFLVEYLKCAYAFSAYPTIVRTLRMQPTSYALHWGSV